MEEWLTKVRRYAELGPDPSVFLPRFRVALANMEDKGMACYQAAEWLGSALYLELAALVYEEAGAAFIIAGNNGYAFICYTNSGLYRHNTGKLDLALEQYGTADELLFRYDADWPYTKEQADVLLWLNACDTLVERRDLDKALERYDRIKDLGLAMADQEAVVRCYLGKGNIYRNKGQLARSLDAYDKAFDLAQQDQGLVQYMARAKHGQCNIFLEFNEIDKAVRAGLDALKLYESVGDGQGRTEALLLLGNVHHFNAEDPKVIVQGQQKEFLKKAKQYYQEAQQAATPQDQINATDAKVKLACLLMAEGDYEAATHQFEQLLDNPLLKSDYFTAYQVWHGLGDLHILKKDYNMALDCYRVGLEFSQQVQDQEGVSKWEALLGAAHEKKGDHEAAMKAYRHSIALQENIGREIREDIHSVGYFSLRVDVYRQLIKLYLGEGEWAQAFNFLERGKAKALRQQLVFREGFSSSIAISGFQEVQGLLL